MAFNQACIIACLAYSRSLNQVIQVGLTFNFFKTTFHICSLNITLILSSVVVTIKMYVMLYVLCVILRSILLESK